ncbi:hypothetical protein EIKCOROL_02314 [Eikenella corrodens ATCC 23834]|uniref:Uncharacterized protein n=1 Tax=Eikenella corrodens ATCC 23834 TaxID=546274 RepID=C0DY52_EIKCO|nr:hypothetical protein EIKCOROL_02314 [Eikenella corrodens ATCC 23834]
MRLPENLKDSALQIAAYNPAPLKRAAENHIVKFLIHYIATRRPAAGSMNNTARRTTP